MLRFNRNTVFSLLILFVFLAIVVRVMPVSVEENFVLVVTKSKEKVRGLSQTRQVKHSKTYKIDVIDLADNNQFKHPKLGNLGYNDDFYTDITGAFYVTTEGKFKFKVESDDGFKLFINNLLICEYAGSRPLAPTSCTANLKFGHNQFKLTHYQGFGHVGLRMQYASVDGKQYWLWGVDSEFIQFGN